MTFFSDIQGRFLEIKKDESMRNGRPDTKNERRDMHTLWTTYREQEVELKKGVETLKNKKLNGREVDEISTYFDACLLRGFQKIDLKDVKVYEPLKNKSKSPGNISICYKYTSCPLDLNQEKIQEALTSGTFNKHHVKGECWINSLMDFYGDSILNPDKKKNIITKFDLLKILNKTEEDLQQGLSIEDIIPFLKNFLFH